MDRPINTLPALTLNLSEHVSTSYTTADCLRTYAEWPAPVLSDDPLPGVFCWDTVCISGGIVKWICLPCFASSFATPAEPAVVSRSIANRSALLDPAVTLSSAGL